MKYQEITKLNSKAFNDEVWDAIKALRDEQIESLIGLFDKDITIILETILNGRAEAWAKRWKYFSFPDLKNNMKTDKFSEWLKHRIRVRKSYNSQNLNKNIANGGQLTALTGVLDYYETHILGGRSEFRSRRVFKNRKIIDALNENEKEGYGEKI